MINDIIQLFVVQLFILLSYTQFYICKINCIVITNFGYLNLFLLVNLPKSLYILFFQITNSCFNLFSLLFYSLFCCISTQFFISSFFLLPLYTVYCSFSSYLRYKIIFFGWDLSCTIRYKFICYNALVKFHKFYCDIF